MEFDVAVLGGGPGGYTAAIRAAQLGAKTVCIEKEDRLGGTCLRVGCIPTKAWVQTAFAIKEAEETFAKIGVNVSAPELDFAKANEWKDGIVNQLTSGVAGLFKANGVEWVKGAGRFKDANTISVEGGEDVTFKSADQQYDERSGATIAGAVRPASPASAMPASAAAEPRQPPTVQSRSEPSPSPLAAAPTVTMPRKTPRVLQPGHRGRLAGREAEDVPGERLDDQLLHEVGGHREQHEDREAARLRLGPDLGEGGAERPGGAGPAAPARPRSSRGIAGDGQGQRGGAEQGDDGEEPARASRGRARRRGRGGGGGDAEDHHQPDHGRRRRAAIAAGWRLASSASSEVAAAPAPEPISGTPRPRARARHRRAAMQHGGERCAEAAGGEHRHAADDPGGARAARVRAVAPVRPAELDGW